MTPIHNRQPEEPFESQSGVVGTNAPDFDLFDENNKLVNLYQAVRSKPAVLAFYPGDFQLVCTKQMCDYRNNIDSFKELGVQLFGISRSTVKQHAEYVEEYNFPFPLLSDLGQRVARLYKCQSLFMLGGVSRATFIISTRGVLLYRYVEPTVLTYKTSSKLTSILQEMKKAQILP